ncbi:MAG: c-type cytochrome [Prosthecobacter sp.]|uniref:c-type cytochrome n=1 Tax=Prosthecobacter sp. TaxID=1965333 RepID=UPI00390063AF
MKPSILAACILPALLASCRTTPTNSVEDQAFSQVRIVLETNCVHCHGDNRLSSMPPINDTHALSKLIGKHWIVPGKPEMSRFFQVITFPDTIPGAMPPTGHAISKKDVDTLRTWIKAGAKVPQQNIKFTPRGEMPRSI